MKICEEIEESYKCTKCRDMTFILVENEALPCECRALREAEDILKKSLGIRGLIILIFLEVWLLWKVIKKLWIMKMSF